MSARQNSQDSAGSRFFRNQKTIAAYFLANLEPTLKDKHVGIGIGRVRSFE